MHDPSVNSVCQVKRDPSNGISYRRFCKRLGIITVVVASMSKNSVGRYYR